MRRLFTTAMSAAIITAAASQANAQGVFVVGRLIPLSQVNQDLGLAGQIRNGAGFEFVGRS